MKVFLIQQKQLEVLNKEQKILETRIQRVDLKKWLPLFEVASDDGQKVCCSLRVQDTGEVRTWADLRLLAEWLREKLGITRCQLLLDDFELPDTE
ncbi:transcriptional regulator [Pseudomonas aeruginosa]|nr:transcriptional regulator [Pseudomonas aeruginosa]